MEYQTYTQTKAIKRKDDDIFGESVTEVSIVDEGCGAFIEIKQVNNEVETIRIDPAEWPLLQSVVTEMFDEIKRIVKK